MRLAAGCALLLLLLLLLALAAGQPLLPHLQDGKGATPQPANNSGELPPPALVEGVMQLVLDLARVAMELHRSGGSRTVSAHQVNISNEPSLLLTFHRTAEAAAALLTPEGQARQLMSLLAPYWAETKQVDKLEELAGRAMDYESSAEASLSDPLPFTIEPLPPPVEPRLDPFSMPPDHTEESSSSAVTDKEKAQGSHPAGEKPQPKKSGEVAERRAGEVSRTVVLMSDKEREDPYGLRFLLHFLEAIHKVVAAVKNLVGHLGELRDSGGDDGGDAEHDVSSKQELKQALTSSRDLGDRVSRLMVAHEHVKGAKPKARGR